MCFLIPSGEEDDGKGWDLSPFYTWCIISLKYTCTNTHLHKVTSRFHILSHPSFSCTNPCRAALGSVLCFSAVSVVWDSCIICYLLPRGSSSATIHLLIHSSLIDYSWSSCFRKQVLVILVMITCMHQNPKCYHLCCCHMWPWEQLGSVAQPWVPYALRSCFTVLHQ